MTHAQLTAELFHDLLEQHLTAIDICARHDLTIHELVAVGC